MYRSVCHEHLSCVFLSSVKLKVVLFSEEMRNLL